MLWFAFRVGAKRKDMILAACACAERALRFVPKGEDRPRLAIEAARTAANTNTKANRAAAEAAALAAARAAAWAAAGAAAWAAAGDAARAAAGDAAGAALRPTVEAMQASAVDLLRRMCAAR